MRRDGLGHWVGWAALGVLLVLCVPFWVEDRLEEAYDPHWWTGLARFLLMKVGLAVVILLYLRAADRRRRLMTTPMPGPPLPPPPRT